MSDRLTQLHMRMKTQIISTALIISSIFISCEKELPLYDDPQSRLNFYYTNDADSLQSYSFNYHPGKDRDTVWFEVRTSGFVSQEDRSFQLEQIPVDSFNALPDVHYVSFDDTNYQKNFTIKGGATSGRIPIIVLKDPSLDKETVTLKFRIKDNLIFQTGNVENEYKLLTITNKLSKPQAWQTLMLFYFGHWGPVKHQFMIDHSGQKWDDDYLNSLGVTDLANCDQAYLAYLRDKLANELYQVNMERMMNGEGWLTDSDGTIIQFTNELYGY